MTDQQQKTMALAGRIIAYVVAGATAWTALKMQVEENGCKIADHETRLRPVEAAMIEQRADMVHIKETLSDIKQAIAP